MSESSATRLSGRTVAESIEDRVKTRVATFSEKAGRVPGLTVLLVGDDPASAVYVKKKGESAEAVGIKSDTIRMPADASHDEVLARVRSLNEDDSVDGILVQLPLPSQVDEEAVLATIDPEKDVDGFNPVNVGRLHVGLPACRPCTPAGVMEALAHHDVNLQGAHAVVVGRSNIVGKPMAALLLAQNATVTICHSRTKDLAATCRSADVLVVAVGRPGFVGGEAVKPGATVIDVGINRIDHPKDDELAARLLGEGTKKHARYLERGHALVGDVDYRSARSEAGLITPVPGGVGPLTIAMLLSNTLDAAARRTGIES